jgi:hypothetical protein
MMNRPKYILINAALILAVSLIGPFFVMGFDQGGARWLKFVLYVGCFASLMSAFLFSSRSSSSCSLSLDHLRKRS